MAEGLRLMVLSVAPLDESEQSSSARLFQPFTVHHVPLTKSDGSGFDVYATANVRFF